MCNLYSITSPMAAILAFGGATMHNVGNFEPMTSVYPDYAAPVVRNTALGRELTRIRWGMPSSTKALFDAASKRADKLRAKGKAVDFDELLRLEPDGGTTNIRNTASRHWQPWLAPSNRCVVPFTSFSEPDGPGGPPVWFALDETRPLAFFAGIWAREWACVRKIKEGLVTCDLFGFLTTAPNAEVRAHHEKAMPVILRTPDEIETWMTSPTQEALQLQRPLPDGSLTVVACGTRADGVLAG